ncbi:MAG: glutamine-hydrolyzing GMP synthase [Peptococcaceae bacterium]|nr:glutamine-hydrolyzing GMP synthase [Peptococcaceae bacterium]
MCTPAASLAEGETVLAEELVLILDFGGQYTQLIARRIRECRVYCEIVPFSTPAGEIGARQPAGLVFSGGPGSVYEPGAPDIDPGIYELGVPVLGICYGMQLMARQLGGVVTPSQGREYGKTSLNCAGESLLDGFGPDEQCWMSHGDRVTVAPPGFRVLAGTALSPVAAIGDPRRRLFGVQFHPEVVHTPRGKEILERFLYDVCGLSGTWTMGSFLAGAVAAVRAQVGDHRVICGLSGGVDSSVAAALVHRAIGGQLTCIFVDHGLLRKSEAAEVVSALGEGLKIRLVHVDAADRFLRRLAGVTDPEAKRKIIGTEFIRVFEDEAARLGQVDFLVQGTLYPDVVESGTATAAVIKSHHNVGGLPEDMKLELVEPLRWLFKDEVRLLGAELGLPEDIIWRQPFPGPGLAVRILGEVTRDRLDLLREADRILIEEIKRAGLYRDIWQCFAVLPDMKSVGVMGDGRTYARTMVVRAVTSADGMTADWARLPYDVLEAVSSRIVNEVPGINRVVYDVTSKPPATIEWE